LFFFPNDVSCSFGARAGYGCESLHFAFCSSQSLHLMRFFFSLPPSPPLACCFGLSAAGTIHNSLANRCFSLLLVLAAIPTRVLASKSGISCSFLFWPSPLFLPTFFLGPRPTNFDWSFEYWGTPASVLGVWFSFWSFVFCSILCHRPRVQKFALFLVRRFLVPLFFRG